MYGWHVYLCSVSMVNSFHQGKHTAISCSASSNGCRQVVALVAGKSPCFSNDFLNVPGPKGLVWSGPCHWVQKEELPLGSAEGDLGSTNSSAWIK